MHSTPKPEFRRVIRFGAMWAWASGLSIGIYGNLIAFTQLATGHSSWEGQTDGSVPAARMKEVQQYVQCRHLMQLSARSMLRGGKDFTTAAIVGGRSRQGFPYGLFEALACAKYRAHRSGDWLLVDGHQDDSELGVKLSSQRCFLTANLVDSGSYLARIPVLGTSCYPA